MTTSEIKAVKTILEKMEDRIDNIDVTLARNTLSLEHHIARTDALESYLKDVIVEKDLIPIKKHVYSVTHAIKGIMWFCIALGGVTGFFLTLKQLGII